MTLPTIESRGRRFVRNLHSLRRARLPLTRWNVRACWAQSDPDWMHRLAFDDEVTDEEWSAYLKALEEIG